MRRGAPHLTSWALICPNASGRSYKNLDENLTRSGITRSRQVVSAIASSIVIDIPMIDVVLTKDRLSALNIVL